MADHSFGREILQLLRSFGASMAHKVSHICAYFLHHKNVGAVAGLAIAFLCTWKLFRVPGPARIIRDKREGAQCSVTAQSQAEDELELTLAKTVKRQLLGARKVTCQLLGVVLLESTPEEIAVRRSATISLDSLQVLLELAKACDLYLFANVCNDESEEAVLAALEVAGLFKQGFNQNKLLFHDTSAGSSSFVRQLEPDWHIDTSLERVQQLSRFVRHELLISAEATSELSSNVFVSTSLGTYFAVPNTMQKLKT